MSFNYYTSADTLITSLESPLQKRTGSIYGPPGAAKLIYFIDGTYVCMYVRMYVCMHECM